LRSKLIGAARDSTGDLPFMCGIFGYVGEQPAAAQVVLTGLRKLEYRGYDSWGIAVQCNGNAVLEKATGKIGQAQTTLPPSGVGLGHTRWATHGGVTEANAHPHLDCTDRLAVIHNGIIENYQELRQEVAAAGHELRSGTDTEVVAHLIEDEVGRQSGPDPLLAATMKVLRRLEGLNAIGVLDVAGQRLLAGKSGSPLVLGWGENANYLASDPNALLEHTRRLTFLENGQVAAVARDGIRLFNLGDGSELTPRVTEVTWASQEADLGGYSDYMTKEIEEQPAVLLRIAEQCGGEAQALAELIQKARGTYLVGCGTAGNAALVAQYLFSRIAARHVNFAFGSEFSYLEHFLAEGSLAIALSQSGETIDIIDSVSAARARGCKIAALVNVEGSTLHRMADFSVLLGAGPERCVLATKSFTAKVALLTMAAYAADGRLDQGRRLVAAAAGEIRAMLHDERREQIAAIAEQVKERDHLYVIGRGLSYPLALESALKIKEVSYVHAEGFAGGELKHGVIALIEPGTPCLVLAPRDETYPAMISGAMEVRARGGLTIGISPEDNEAFDLHIRVADLGNAASLINVLPGQLLAYNLAKLRGYDPDKPRNLAKSVTVK
jgi:glutamine---fructose-6-phosphate transaminase (isomerizing)